MYVWRAESKGLGDTFRMYRILRIFEGSVSLDAAHSALGLRFSHTYHILHNNRTYHYKQTVKKLLSLHVTAHVSISNSLPGKSIYCGYSSESSRFENAMKISSTQT